MTVNHMIILLHIKLMVHYFSLETKAQIKSLLLLPNVNLLNNGVYTRLSINFLWVVTSHDHISQHKIA